MATSPKKRNAPIPLFPPREIIVWMWHGYLKKHTALFILSVLLMSLQGGMLGVLSYLIGPMFDEVFTNKNTNALTLLGIGVFVIFCVRGFSGLGQRSILAYIGEKINFELKTFLMRHIMALDDSFFGKYPPGDLMARVQGDAEAVRSIWSGFIGPGIKDSVSIISCIAVAIYIDPLWTIVTCIGVPILVFPISRLQKLVKQRSIEHRWLISNMTVLMDEVFHGIQIVKLYLLEKILQGRFVGFAKRVQKIGVKVAIQNSAIPTMIDVVAGFGFLGMLYLGGNEVISGEKTTGEFMSFFTAIVLVFDPLKRLSSLATYWQITLASLERVYAIVSHEPSPKNK
ncbi:MAG: ABC transporter transmembrane domain-containing protein [Rhodobacteraceae bacterium]|nr:ABC transporter transmembrane domain-containing protein [Paracoccaceae bacterium]